MAGYLCYICLLFHCLVSKSRLVSLQNLFFSKWIECSSVARVWTGRKLLLKQRDGTWKCFHNLNWKCCYLSCMYLPSQYINASRSFTFFWPPSLLMLVDCVWKFILCSCIPCVCNICKNVYLRKSLFILSGCIPCVCDIC